MEKEQYFTVTVDTEADDAWSKSERIELKNLSEITRFQELCEKYSIIPTYLVAYECATRDEAVSVLKPLSDTGRCEIGHHLHCWTTPPFQKKGTSGVDLAWIHAYQSELPDNLFREKAEVLSVAIEKAYGKKPTSHRAGRWGIDQRTIEWLIENGFIVDSSVVPLTSFYKCLGRTMGGPSFYTSPYEPYFCYTEQYYKNDNKYLIEIPVSVGVPDNILSKICASYLRKKLPGANNIRRLLNKSGGGKKLSPNPHYSDGIQINIMKGVVKEHMPIVNMILHSSELAYGCSPFTRNKDDYVRVWKKLEEVFKYKEKIGIKTASISECAYLLKERKYCKRVQDNIFETFMS